MGHLVKNDMDTLNKDIKYLVGFSSGIRWSNLGSDQVKLESRKLSEEIVELKMHPMFGVHFSYTKIWKSQWNQIFTHAWYFHSWEKGRMTQGKENIFKTVPTYSPDNIWWRLKYFFFHNFKRNIIIVVKGNRIHTWENRCMMT